MGQKTNILVYFLITIFSFVLYCHFLVTGDIVSEHMMTCLILLVFMSNVFSLFSYQIPLFHPYVFFLLTFFLYNVGGFFIALCFGESFFNYSFGLSSGGGFSSYEKGETMFSILFFLIFIHWGVVLFCKIKKQNKYQFLEESFEPDIYSITNRKIGLLLFYISLLPVYYYYYVYIKEAYLMGGYSNYAYAVDSRLGTENLNFFIRIADDLNTFGFILFLSSRPTKKQFVIPAMLYFIPLLLVSTFTGSRVYAISYGMMLLTYFILVYNVSYKKISYVLLIFVFYATLIGVFRNVEDYDLSETQDKIEDADNNIFRDFFVVQGLSAQTITFTVSLHEDGKLDFSPLFFVMPLISKGGYDEGKLPSDYYHLPDRISYYYNDNFSIGGGLGGSIVADFYSVGGIICVMLFSMLFGFIFMSGINIVVSKRSFIAMAILLFLLPGIYYLPRAYFVYPIVNSAFSLLLLFLYYFFIFKFIPRKQIDI